MIISFLKQLFCKHIEYTDIKTNVYKNYLRTTSVCRKCGKIITRKENENE